jgi:hypothetical protein
MSNSVRKVYDYDVHTKMHHERTIMDVESIVDENTDVRNNGNNGFSKERNFRKIGSIPMLLLNEAFKEGINPMDGSPEADKWLRKFLQANPKFMTVDRLKTNKVGIIK